MTDALEEPRFGAIVVGAGAAGGWAAKILTEGGLRVLLLDAGRNVDPVTDFPPPQRGNAIRSRLAALVHGQHIQARCISFGEATKHFYVNDRECPYVSPRKSPFLWFRGRQVGGRMHTWARSALRMSDHEFHGDGTRGDGQWPLRYDELAPFYDLVERTLGVHGTCSGLDSVPDGQFIAPPEMSPAELLLKQRLQEQTGLTLMHNRVVQHNPDRIPIPLQHALKTGRLTIQSNSVVSHLIFDQQSGSASGVAYIDRLTKRPAEVQAPVIVLCASALESVRLLLNSANKQHPQGVGGSSGVLGHYVCDHVSFGKGGRLSDDYRQVQQGFEPPKRDPYDFGVYSMYLPNFCGYWGAPPDFAGGYGFQIGCTPTHWWALGFGEMQPRFENRLVLSKRKKDAWGIPVADIDVRHSDNEERMVKHIANSIETLCKEVGLAAQLGGHKAPRFYQRWIISMLKSLVFTPSGAFWPGAAIHETGGARMGNDARSSVVNRYGQVWDVPNVFVTDGACFPSAGYQNHTLTIMALTARACDYIVRQYANRVDAR